MSEISAVLSSKGQITLPKTVRDMLDIETGDRIYFDIHEKNSVSMRKGDGNDESIYNLIHMLLHQFGVVAIEGNTASGKTHLMLEFFQRFFSEKKVAFIQSPIVLNAENHSKSVIFINANIANLDRISKENFDLVIIDDGKEFKDIEHIQKLTSANCKVIIVRQSFNGRERMLFGDHVSIKTNKNKVNGIEDIHQITMTSDWFKKTKIYSE